MNKFGSNLNCRRIIKFLKIQNGGQDGGHEGGLKLELPITQPFMMLFRSNLNRRGKTKCQKIK